VTAVAPPDPPPTDGTVVLRMRRWDDVEHIAAALDDPETRKWLDDPPLTPELLRTSVARAEEGWRSGRRFAYVIADATTDEALGLINLDGATAAVAYSVFPAARGRGVAGRALALLVAWACTELGLAGIALRAHRGNVASIRVAEKAGFDRLPDEGDEAVFVRECG
jgi:RimJ/RimL family protein N-acetyltransferase